MRKSLLMLALCGMFLATSFAQEKAITISGDFRGSSFTEFVQQLEQKYGLQFFYHPEWVESLQIDRSFETAPLEEVLQEIFEHSELFFHINKSGQVFLTRKYALTTDLYAKTPNQDALPGSGKVKEQEVQQEVTQDFEVITLGSKAAATNGKVSVSGYIKDPYSGEPVIGAVVFIDELEAGSMTNAYGYYSFTIPAGSYQVQYSCLGRKKVDLQLNAWGNGNVDIEMQEKLIPLKGVTVTANSEVALARKPIGLEKLSMQTINLMPTSLGEADIIKSVVFLPGVQTAGEGASGFNVRGGSVDQNLILLYKAPVFNTSHFFGFFSAFNPEVIKDISLYKGGIPAQYGGRVSSVLDIIPRDGNSKSFQGSGGISPVTSQFMIEGPLKQDKTHFLVAGRSTYSNWLLDKLEDPAISNSEASFYDINARLIHEINDKNKLEFSGYTSKDRFKFNQDTIYDYRNNILSASWRHEMSKNLFAVFNGSFSNYEYNISSDEVAEQAFDLYHQVNYIKGKAAFTWFPDYRQKIHFGLQTGYYSLTPGELTPVGDSSLIIPTLVNPQRGLETSLYLNDEFDLNNVITINAGLRLTSFLVTGPATVQSYNPEYPRSNSTVTDATDYNAGDLVKSYLGPEYRMSVNFQVTPSSSVKLNYNKTRQNIHLLSNTTSVSPTDIWVLSDYHIKPQVGDQVALGLYKNFRSDMIETSVEAYYKKIKNMIDFKGGARLLLNEHLETDIVNAEGKAYGVELMVKKSKGRLNGWVSYTWSRIFLQSRTDFPSEAINDGKWFPANYDKPHDLTILANLLVSRRLSFSSTYTYSTGRPITYPIATYELNNTKMLHYSERNQYRIPDYSRLDLSMTISGNLKSKKLAHSTLTFSVFNVLGRSNVYSVYFKNDGVILKGYKLSVFARPVPSITYNFKF